MPLQKLQFRPGIVRDLTGYTNENGWRDGNLVRFRLGFPETIGGWQKYSDQSFLGVCRSLLNWTALDGSDYMAMGTTWKYYVEEGGFYNDITPLRATATLINPFTATNGSAILTVADTAHGCIIDDFVTFSGATGLGGNVTATVLNANHQVTEVVDANTYRITLSVTANATDAAGSPGGGTVTASYEITVGLDSQVGGTGWGAGSWSRGSWGSGTNLGVSNQIRIWTQDNYGEDLIFNVRGGGVYYWDSSAGGFARGVTLSSLSSDSETPTVATQVMVSDRDRHVIAFGANSGGSTDPDPLRIRFSSQEDPFTWTPTATNTAGDLRIGSGSRIVRAVETKREIVVFTDVALYSMQFLGPPYTFGLQQIAANITINGFNSAVAVDDAVYWMGKREFSVYSGQTQEITCPILNYVFNDYNEDQSDKVYAAHNSEFSEVTWFYPSASSEENDRYVTYNYMDGAWSYGSLARTAWIDRGVRTYPQAVSPDGYLYDHEYGTDDGSVNPPVGLDAYVESAPFDIGEGDKFSFVRRIIPDVNFFNSTNEPTVNFVMKTQNYPGSNYAAGSDSAVIRTATVPVDQYTQVKDVRLRGRSVILRVESDKVGTRWSLGSPRIEIRSDGGR